MMSPRSMLIRTFLLAVVSLALGVLAYSTAKMARGEIGVSTGEGK